MRAHWVVVLVFLSGCGAEDEVSSEADDVPTPTEDPCDICRNVTIPASDMNATLRLIAFDRSYGCNMKRTCVYEILSFPIAPLADYGIVLDLEDFKLNKKQSTYAVIEEFYYKDGKEIWQQRMFQLYDRDRAFLHSAKGSGLRIIMFDVVKTTSEDVGYYSTRMRYYRTQFTIQMTRSNNDSRLCPPFHYVVREAPTHLSLDFGLYFTPNIIYCSLRFDVASPNMTLYIEESSPNRYTLTPIQMTDGDRYEENADKKQIGSFTEGNTTSTLSTLPTLFLRVGHHRMSATSPTVLNFTASSRPDVCLKKYTPLVELKPNQTFVFHSRGYPYYECVGHSDEVNFTSPHSEQSDHFILVTFSSATYGSTNIYAYDFQGKELARYGYSSSVTSFLLPGNVTLRYESAPDQRTKFNITLTPVTQPKDCSEACVLFASSLLGSFLQGNASLSIPSHCVDIDCYAFIQEQKDQEKLAINISMDWSTINKDEFLSITSADEFIDKKFQPTRHYYYGDITTNRVEQRFGSPVFPATRTEPTNITLHYHRKAIHLYNTALTVSYEWSKYCDCGSRTLFHVNESHSESITSPNYPSDYCQYANCRYTIIAPEGQNILMKVMDFVTAERADHVTIIEEVNGRQKDIGLLFGSVASTRLGESERMKSNKITVWFVSDRTDNDRGFRLDFSSELASSPSSSAVDLDVSSLVSPSTPLPLHISTFIKDVVFILAFAALVAFLYKKRRLSYLNPGYTTNEPSSLVQYNAVRNHIDL